VRRANEPGEQPSVAKEYPMSDPAKKSVVISVADESDIEGIIDVHSAVAAEMLWLGVEFPVDREKRRKGSQAMLQRDDSLALVARDAERVVGELSLWPTWPGLLYLGMAVAADFRSQGVGTALMQRGIEWARTTTNHKIFLEVFVHNTAAIALYERHGFVREGLFRSHVRRRTGEIWDSIPMGLLL
jgi:RimJ/RimL family protein N-acetyltransferase